MIDDHEVIFPNLGLLPQNDYNEDMVNFSLSLDH
jgi:hypothetical protein